MADEKTEKSSTRSKALQILPWAILAGVCVVWVVSAKMKDSRLRAEHAQLKKQQALIALITETPGRTYRR